MTNIHFLLLYFLRYLLIHRFFLTFQFCSSFSFSSLFSLMIFIIVPARCLHICLFVSIVDSSIVLQSIFQYTVFLVYLRFSEFMGDLFRLWDGVTSLRVFPSNFLISAIVHLIIPKLYCITGTAKDVIADA